MQERTTGRYRTSNLSRRLATARSRQPAGVQRKRGTVPESSALFLLGLRTGPKRRQPIAMRSLSQSSADGHDSHALEFQLRQRIPGDLGKHQAVLRDGLLSSSSRAWAIREAYAGWELWNPYSVLCQGRRHLDRRPLRMRGQRSYLGLNKA